MPAEHSFQVGTRPFVRCRSGPRETPSHSTVGMVQFPVVPPPRKRSCSRTPSGSGEYLVDHEKIIFDLEINSYI